MRPGRIVRAASTSSASRATPANWRGSGMRSRLTEAGKAKRRTTDYADSRRLDLQSKALTTKDTKSTKKSEQENGEFGFAFTFVSFVLFVVNAFAVQPANPPTSQPPSHSTASAYTAAIRSSSMMPNPPCTLRSSQPIGQGLAMSNTRKATNAASHHAQ